MGTAGWGVGIGRRGVGGGSKTPRKRGWSEGMQSPLFREFHIHELAERNL